MKIIYLFVYIQSINVLAVDTIANIQLDNCILKKNTMKYHMSIFCLLMFCFIQNSECWVSIFIIEQLKIIVAKIYVKTRLAIATVCAKLALTNYSLIYN